MKRYAKGFFKRIIDDFKYKELLSLKMVFFVHASTVFVLYPYLTIQMRELGISVEETAIMSALTPCVAILMPPIAGMVADRIGNFKVLLALLSAVGGIAALFLLLVPAGRVTIPFPDQVVLSMECANDTGGSFNFTLAEGEQCLRKWSTDTFDSSLSTSVPLDYTNINITLESCGLICSVDQKNQVASLKNINRTKYFSIIVHDINHHPSHQHDYNITAKDFALPGIPTAVIKDVRIYRSQKKSKNFRTSVQAFTSQQFFFPAPGLFNFTCNIQKNFEEVYNCSIKKFEEGTVGNFPYRRFTFTNIIPTSSDDNNNEIVAFSHGSSMHGVATNWPNKMDTNCYQEKWNTSVQVHLDDENGRFKKPDDILIEFKECKPRCIMKTTRKYLCKNRSIVKEFDVKFTFWMYLTVRVLIGIISGTAFAMFEGAVIAILREHNADYGLQHIYASIGGMISSPLSGYLIDYYSRGKGYTDFRPAFYFYAVLKIISAVLMLTMNLEFKAPAKNVVSDVVIVLKRIEIVALFFTCFILGTAWGYIESFLFWVLQDLGATRSLMGITITVGGIMGIPLLVMSGPIIEHIGHANVLFVGFVFYAIRLLGYSIITSPYQCLIFEAMESVTSSLAFTAAVTYAAKLSSTQTDSSIQGILGGLYFGVGKGSGSLFGGYLIKYFGSRNTFRIFSAATLGTGCIYFLFNKFYISKLPPPETEKEKEKSEKISTTNGFIEVHEISESKNGAVKSQNENEKENKKDIYPHHQSDQHNHHCDPPSGEMNLAYLTTETDIPYNENLAKRRSSSNKGNKN